MPKNRFTFSDYSILARLYKEVFENDFDRTNRTHRLRLQKIVFILHEMGIKVGNYSFSWCYQGVFSDELRNTIWRIKDDDLQEELKNHLPMVAKLTHKATQALRKIKNVYNDINSHYHLDIEKYIEPIGMGKDMNEKDFWLEAMTSCLYLSLYVQPYSTKDEIASLLKTRCPAFNNETINQMSLEAGLELIKEGEKL